MMIAAAVIPVVSACNIRSKNSEGCQKNESFQGSLPSRGDLVTIGNIVCGRGPDYPGIEQAAHQMALEAENVNATLTLC